MEPTGYNTRSRPAWTAEEVQALQDSLVQVGQRRQSLHVGSFVEQPAPTNKRRRATIPSAGTVDEFFQDDLPLAASNTLPSRQPDSATQASSDQSRRLVDQSSTVATQGENQLPIQQMEGLHEPAVESREGRNNNMVPSPSHESHDSDEESVINDQPLPLSQQLDRIFQERRERGICRPEVTPWPGIRDDYDIPDWDAVDDRSHLLMEECDITDKKAWSQLFTESKSSDAGRFSSATEYRNLQILTNQLVERYGKDFEVARYLQDNGIAQNHWDSMGRFNLNRRHWEETRRFFDEILRMKNWLRDIRQLCTEARGPGYAPVQKHLVPPERPSLELPFYGDSAHIRPKLTEEEDNRSHASEMSDDPDYLGVFPDNGELGTTWDELFSQLPVQLQEGLQPPRRPDVETDGYLDAMTFPTPTARLRHRLKKYRFAYERLRVIIASFMHLWYHVTLHLRMTYPVFADDTTLRPSHDSETSNERWPVVGFTALLGGFAHFQAEIDRLNLELCAALKNSEGLDKAKLRIGELETYLTRMGEEKKEAEDTATRLQTEVLSLRTTATRSVDNSSSDTLIATLTDATKQLQKWLDDSEAQVVVVQTENSRHLQTIKDLVIDMDKDKTRFSLETDDWTRRFTDQTQGWNLRLREVEDKLRASQDEVRRLRLAAATPLTPLASTNPPVTATTSPTPGAAGSYTLGSASILTSTTAATTTNIVIDANAFDEDRPSSWKLSEYGVAIPLLNDKFTYSDIRATKRLVEAVKLKNSLVQEPVRARNSMYDKSAIAAINKTASTYYDRDGLTPFRKFFRITSVRRLRPYAHEEFLEPSS